MSSIHKVRQSVFWRIVIRQALLINVEARCYSYKVDKRTRDILLIVVDAWNHGWDAIRYSLDGYPADGMKPEVHCFDICSAL